MKENQAVADRFQATTTALIELIAKFDKDTFNRKPSADQWSAGEVVEHLLTFDTRLNQILTSTTHAAERNMDEKVSVFTARVSDRANKIDAPPFLLPTAGEKSASLLIEQIRTERKKIIETLAQIDLSLLSKEYPHRLFGELTANEWIQLVDVHTHRHLAQLQELLSGKK